MKNVIIGLIVMATLSGCAHKTIHEYCSENSDKYSSYDECYQDESVQNKRESFGSKVAKAVGAMLGGAGEGAQRSNRQVSCTSYTYGYTTQTTCN